MNFKNSDFLMFLVAFLVGYFFQEIMNGGGIIEGNNHYKLNCDHCRRIRSRHGHCSHCRRHYGSHNPENNR